MGRKKASFRGTWYPDSKDECESHIKDYLKDNNGIQKGNFQGCIVPHAGWYFSGSIACRTIASLASQNKERNRDCVVIFGLHMHKNDSPFLLESGSWETPFGDLDINSMNLIIDAQVLLLLTAPSHILIRFIALLMLHLCFGASSTFLLP